MAKNSTKGRISSNLGVYLGFILEIFWIFVDLCFLSSFFLRGCLSLCSIDIPFLSLPEEILDRR
jgi:hypothetical protein